MSSTISTAAKMISYTIPIKLQSHMSRQYGPSELIKPKAMRAGDTIGIFTPSWPANVILKEKYQHALSEICRLGFKFKEGHLSCSGKSQGYRSGTPKERAEEFMSLINDPTVNCLMATIGGSNSSSMLPFLDYAKVRSSRKIVCGYSDISSLLLAILKNSGLSTFYGPTVVPIFGEYPNIEEFAFRSFFDLATNTQKKKKMIIPPKQWSNHFIDATLPDWKLQKREYKVNTGWNTLSTGVASAHLVVSDLETLVSVAQTDYFPQLDNCILLIEEMDAPFSKEERNLRQLELMGVFDHLSGLIVSKPFNPDSEGANFTYDDLILEVVGRRPYPIISNFDCGHCFPMITLSQGLKVTLEAFVDSVKFYLDDCAVD